MTKYLTVLDKNETPLGYLSKAKFVEIRDRLNSETLLSFEIPFDVDETKHITLEGFVIDDVGQKYVIRSIEKSETNKRNLIVGCVHVFNELAFDYIDRTVELFGVDCLTAVTEALQGTEFTIGAINVEGLHDIDISEIYVLKALQNIRDKWNCDLWFDNRTVYLGQKGEDKNEEIRQGKNLKTIKEPTDSNKVITRLYVYGKDGLTIESVNNNVKYIDSPYINDYRRPKCGKVVFNDISDQDELKYEGEKYLSKNDTPNVSYQISFVELEKLGKEPKKISVGDTIAITHTKFGMDKLKTRVQEYIRYPFETKLGSITLSSIVETSIDDFVNLKKDQKKTDEYINKRFKETSDTLTTYDSEITQNATDITLRVTKETYDADINDATNGLKTRMNNAELKITDDSIISTVTGSETYNTDLSAIETNANNYTDAEVLLDRNRMSTIEQDLSGVTTTVNSHETSIGQFDIDINGDGATVDGLKYRMNSAEQKITDTAIVSTVRTSTEYQGDLTMKEDSIIKQTTAPTHLNGKLWLDTSVTPNVLYRSDGATWQKASPTDASEIAYDGSDLDTRMKSAESSITQNADDITLKVSSTDYNGDTIVSKINLDAISATIEAENINLNGITKVASEIYIGQDATTDAFKGIYFRNTTSGPRIISNSSDNLLISSMNITMEGTNVLSTSSYLGSVSSGNQIATMNDVSGGDLSNYYTKTESDDRYAYKSHTHSGYASSTHNHDGTYIKHYYSGDDIQMYVNSLNELVVYKKGSLVGKAALN